MKDGQTIGQWLNWDFEANGDLKIKDKNGKPIYFEASNEFSARWEYDSQGNQIYFEDSYKYWAKWEWNSEGNEIYYEDSSGKIIDNRVQTITYEGRKYQLIP